MLKVLSLFSGKGAFEKALENLNTKHEVVNYCEIDKFASKAYSVIHNIKEEKNLGDISKVDTKNIQDFDLLTYGFPCQDISLSGKMKGIIQGETRSGLLYEALRIIKDKKPKYAIAENVKNLASKLFINDFNMMIEKLSAMGYNSYWKILNSENYGVAQSRERIFIVSIRKDIDRGEFKFPDKIDSNVKLADILEETTNQKYFCTKEPFKEFIRDINNRLVTNKNLNKSKLRRVGIVKNLKALDMNKRVFSEEGVSPTIMTSSDNVPKILQCKVRKLTPLECWRANAFDDEDYYKVKAALEESFYNGQDRSDTQMYKMAGNSIPVKMLEHILKNLIQQELE